MLWRAENEQKHFCDLYRHNNRGKKIILNWEYNGILISYSNVDICIDVGLYVEFVLTRKTNIQVKYQKSEIFFSLLSALNLVSVLAALGFVRHNKYFLRSLQYLTLLSKELCVRNEMKWDMDLRNNWSIKQDRENPAKVTQKSRWRKHSSPITVVLCILPGESVTQGYYLSLQITLTATK